MDARTMHGGYAAQSQVGALLRLVDAAASWQFRQTDVFGSVVVEGKYGELVQWNVKTGEVSTLEEPT